MVGVEAGLSLDPHRIAEPLARVSGVVAVALGGSRAQGTHRADSDWDFGLYYREHIDTDPLRALRWKGEVTEPGAWAYPMNGRAWLTVEGRKVDLLYRDLDDVERWVARAERGEWELYRVPGYLAGLEEAVEDRRRRAAALAQEVADAPPTAADLATALDQLPLLDRLPELPQPELRTLYDSLRLQVAFQPGEAAVDVEVALFADEPSDRRKEVAEVQSVPPGGIEPPTPGSGMGVR